MGRIERARLLTSEICKGTLCISLEVQRKQSTKNRKTKESCWKAGVLSRVLQMAEFRSNRTIRLIIVDLEPFVAYLKNL
jgi:hypothetical protein